MAGNKFEHTWVKVGKIIPKQLLGVSIDNELKFDKHALNIIKKLILSSAHHKSDQMCDLPKEKNTL